MANQLDEIDLAALEWAKQRRIIFGIVGGDRIQPHERLGKLNCTLGAVKEDRVSAGSGTATVELNGHPFEDFPEVYVGIALDIHRAFQFMAFDQRTVVSLHYVWRELPKADRVREAGMAETNYFKVLAAAKSFLRGYLAAMSASKPDISAVEQSPALALRK